MDKIKDLDNNFKLVNKVVSKMFYYIPVLIDLDDDDLYDEIITYILTELGKVKVEKFTDREYAHFAVKVAKKFNLKVSEEAYRYILKNNNTLEEATRELESILGDDLEYLLTAYDMLGELLPGLEYATDDQMEQAFELMHELLPLDDPKQITNLELAQIAYVISDTLGVEAHPELEEYLSKQNNFN